MCKSVRGLCRYTDGSWVVKQAVWCADRRNEAGTSSGAVMVFYSRAQSFNSRHPKKKKKQSAKALWLSWTPGSKDPIQDSP